jgi:3'-5' exonuclease
MLLRNGYIRNLLFIDIETVSGHATYEGLMAQEQELWYGKHKTLKAEEPADVGYSLRAGIYAEFAKVVCISMGYFKYDRETNQDQFRIKSISGDDEQQVLSEFATLLGVFHDRNEKLLFCGHNIREFDLPFLCRRMIVNRVKLPVLLDMAGKKPWETEHLDTMQLWKFGDYKHFTSLKLLAYILGIPSPKGDIDGKDVGRVYYQEGDLARISAYCQRDVVTTARVMMRLKQELDELTDEDVVSL